MPKFFRRWLLLGFAVACEPTPDAVGEVISRKESESGTAAPLLRQPARSLSERERIGKKIYLEGEGAGPTSIQAQIGGQGPLLPAATLPCGGCHGKDGRGRPEGGLVPSDLRWSRLTRSYTVTTESGRTHGPYDEASFIRAVTMGIDAAGNPLHVAMPRYRLSHADAGALVSWIQHMEHGRVPDHLVVATVLPKAGPRAAAGRAVRQAIEAYFKELNARGGLYERSIELEVIEMPGPDDARLSSLRSFLAEHDPFVLLAPMVEPGADAALVELASALEIPVIGPLSLSPTPGNPPVREVFYVLGGVDQEAGVLGRVAAAASQKSGAALAVLRLGESVPESALEAAQDAIGQQGREEALTLSVTDQRTPSEVVSDLHEAKIDQVLILGAGSDLVQVLDAAADQDWQPKVYALGSMAGSLVETIGPAWLEKLTLSFPSVPSDLAPSTAARVAGLTEIHGLGQEHRVLQYMALAATELLVAGLMECGRELTRKHLVDALERLHAFKTGLTRPLSYDANRRIGALGAYIQRFQTNRRPSGEAEWVPLSRTLVR